METYKNIAIYETQFVLNSKISLKLLLLKIFTVPTKQKILRFEIKFIKRYEFNKLGIRSILDLKRKSALQFAFIIFIKISFSIWLLLFSVVFEF